MSNVQRIIKYAAIALAIFLILNIISGIIFAVVVMGTIFSNKNEISENLESLTVTSSPYILDIETSSVNIMIQEGDTFKVETNNKNIITKEINGKLIICEKSWNWFGKTNTSELVISIPVGLSFDELVMETGAGKINIESLSTKRLDLDLGAGKVEIGNLIVEKQTEIDGGAGEIVINDSKLHNLDLDQGIGKVAITAKITGSSEINSGVGALELNLLGTKEDYRIKIDKGIGIAKIGEEEMKSNTYYGDGTNFIDIDGGISSIKIKYQ